MASSVSAEKLPIFECSGGTLVTVYAAGNVKSGGITGLTFDSTNGEPNVGCRGELLDRQRCSVWAKADVLTLAGLDPSPELSNLDPSPTKSSQDYRAVSSIAVQADRSAPDPSFPQASCAAVFVYLASRRCHH